MADDLPPSLGAAGLTGRPQLPPRPTLLEEPIGFDETTGEPIWESPRAVGKAIPPNCLRVLSSPLPVERGGGCTVDCPGLQRDGSCLLDIVRAAAEQGVEPEFEINSDGVALWWDYVGPPLAPYEEPVVEVVPDSFECPHCGATNVQDPANFHFWCSACGKNAKDPA